MTPSTPSKHTETKIPSPKDNSPKARKRSASPIRSLPVISTPSFSRPTFFQDNKLELQRVTKDLMTKKAELDVERNTQFQIKNDKQELEFKLHDLNTSKMKYNRVLRQKENELKDISIKLLSHEANLNEQHELNLQELKLENDSKIYQAEREMNAEIEKLQYDKKTKWENEKKELERKVKEVKFKVDNREMLLNEEKMRLLEQHEQRKRDLDRDMRLEKEKLDAESERLDQELEELEKRKLEIAQSLSQASEKNEALNEQLNSKMNNVSEHQKRVSHTNTTVKELKIEIKGNDSKRDELMNYIDNSQSQVKEINSILIKEETLRRELHNTMQDLKGNIRVFCRIRPPLPSETECFHTSVADFEGFDQKLTVSKDKRYQFHFDKVFGMKSSNDDIFCEISQLVQSSLDGFNVCIFAYGQTGSGKTYTMLNEDGMIPQTLNHVFMNIAELKTKGWSYVVTGEFLEIYNENIVDLLQGASQGKHEVRHDPMTRTTTVTDVKSIKLNSSQQMSDILNLAAKNRSTASTNANERSSRSHSIFVINLQGSNSITGESCNGVLNLIDLAGSERITSSQVTGDRLKETQNINKSLSCLGDVIHALKDNDQERHIPFRNSKLTYLLQYSLTGGSKTLMFVNISPNAVHFNESVNSLRFATKVNSTKIGRSN